MDVYQHLGRDVSEPAEESCLFTLEPVMPALSQHGVRAKETLKPRSRLPPLQKPSCSC